MKINKEVVTNITVILTPMDVEKLIKNHIKETEGIDVDYVNFITNGDNLTSVTAIVSKVEKIK